MKTIYDLECWLKNQNLGLKICFDKGKFRVRANDRFNGESKTLEQAFENCMIEMRTEKTEKDPLEKVTFGYIIPAATANLIVCPTCGKDPYVCINNPSTLQCSCCNLLFRPNLVKGSRANFRHPIMSGKICEFDGTAWKIVP